VKYISGIYILIGMPGETTRKAFRLGGSVVVALPADCVKYYNLEGKEVKVLYDSLLVIIPPNARISRQRLEQIRRLLEGR